MKIITISLIQHKTTGKQILIEGTLKELKKCYTKTKIIGTCYSLLVGYAKNYQTILTQKYNLNDKVNIN